MNNVGVVNDGVNKVRQACERDFVIIAVELCQRVVLLEHSSKGAGSLNAQFLMLNV